MPDMIEFIEWLHAELSRQGISQAELARRSEISAPQISRILSMQSSPSPESVVAIARAVGSPPDYALRLAGLLPDYGNMRRVAEQVANYKLQDLTEEQLDEVIKYIDWITSRDDKSPPGKNKIYKVNREGETPPEVVK